MGSSSGKGSPTSNIIDILFRIDARLEALDRRLQALEPSLAEQRPSTPSVSPAVAVPVASRLAKYRAFNAKYEIRPDKQDRLRKIIIFGKGLLVLLMQISNSCLKRDRWYHLEPNQFHKTVDPPFTQLMTYWDTLKFLCNEDGQEENQLRSFLFKPLTPQFRKDISDLLSCLVDTNGDHIGPRKDALRGVVLFENLPILFGPGNLLIGTRGTDTQQVVEVSSCEIGLSPAGSDRCMVEFWHLQWGGKAFSRTGGRFLVERYAGTRPITGLPFRPIITTDCENSIAEVQRLIARNQRALEIFKRFPGTDTGDYPYLCIKTRSGTGGGHGTMFLEPVILDPESFSLNNDRPKTETSFGCYCPNCTGLLTLEDVLGNPRYLLLAPIRVGGYHVLSKQWSTFVISNLSDYIPLSRSDVLDNLYLDNAMAESLKVDFARYFEHRRKLLRVQSLTNAEVGGDARCGRLVIHFDGPRGAGKTGLAMSLAEYCKRPILFLHSADMGKKPATFGRQLATYAELCFRWGAILVLTKADHLLQSGMIDDRDMTRIALRRGLLDVIRQFEGIMIIVTSHIASMDHSLLPYIRQVHFSPLSPESIVNISSSFLSQVDHDLVGSRDEILEWVADTAANSRLSGREAQEVLRDTIGSASAGKQSLCLDDILKLYTEKTGRPNEWDFVADTSSYHDHQDDTTTTVSDVGKALTRAFGAVCSIPDDGRLPLVFSSAFCSHIVPRWALEGISALRELTESLRRAGNLRIIDWGWPKALWSPQEGCVYEFGGNRQRPAPQEQWKKLGFTFGLRRLIGNDEYGAKYGQPWRRLLLFEGVEELEILPQFPLSQTTVLNSADCTGETSVVPWRLPWIAFRRAEGTSLNAFHLHCTHLCRNLIAHTNALPLRHPTAHSQSSKHEHGFHIVFYELVSPTGHPDDDVRLRRTVPFYARTDIRLRKGSFTLFHIPPIGAETPVNDPIHWTMVCLTPPEFLTQEQYATCISPSLRAQFAHYVAKTLTGVAERWTDILGALEGLVDSGDVLRQQDRLQDILFDDDAFSTSKRYFWAINFMHEAINLLDDTIQQWGHYQKRGITPFKMELMAGREDHWREKAQEVLATAEAEAEQACEELKLLREDFQDKLERITVMRDGLFNASAVMESRASTQLGENVKLLTFVSIFFLPLTLCVAIWSINETYNHRDLITVTVIVAIITYSVTMNLNNLARGFRKMYAPKRRALVERMEQDHEWRTLGHRFKAFQRAESGQNNTKPSEWMIVGFVLWLGCRVVGRGWRRAGEVVRGWG